MYICRANKDIYTLYNYIIGYTIYISIPDRLYNSPFGLPFIIPSPSFACTRSWVGFGGLLGELPLLLLVLRGIWTWGLSLLLNLGACIIGAPKFTLGAFGGTFNFSSGITLHRSINLLCWYLAPSLVDTT